MFSCSGSQFFWRFHSFYPSLTNESSQQGLKSADLGPRFHRHFSLWLFIRGLATPEKMGGVWSGSQNQQPSPPALIPHSSKAHLGSHSHSLLGSLPLKVPGSFGAQENWRRGGMGRHLYLPFEDRQNTLRWGQRRCYECPWEKPAGYYQSSWVAPTRSEESEEATQRKWYSDWAMRNRSESGKF